MAGRRTRSKSIKGPDDIPVSGQGVEAEEFTLEERAPRLEAVIRVLRELVMDELNAVTMDVERGFDLTTSPDGVSTGFRKNSTATILVQINGGARGTWYPHPGSEIYRDGRLER